jgi:hypothetical protein
MTEESLHQPAVPCSATTKYGKPCRSFASGDAQPPRCYRHSLSPEEARELGQRGAASTNEQRARKAAENAAAKVQQAIATLPQSEVKIAIGDAQSFTESLTSVMVAVTNGSLSPTRARALQGFFKLRLDAESLAISQKLVELERRMEQQRKGVVRG